MKRSLLLLLLFLFCSTVWAQDNATPQPVATSETIQPIDSVSEEYKRIWNDDLNAQIDARIEKYRKADAVVNIENAEPGTEVRIEQRTHKFLFGAHLFNFDQLGSDELNAKYKDLYREDGLFNAATLGFYWSAFEITPGDRHYKSRAEDSAEFWNTVKDPFSQPFWRRPCPEKIIEFCKSRNIDMHGHPIIYCRIFPNWLPDGKKFPQEREAAFMKHARGLIEYYRNDLSSWDVVNESVDPIPGQPRYGEGFVPEDYTFKTYQLAADLFPTNVKLAINDSWRDVYPPFILDLMNRGAKIDIVGLQMHIFASKPMLDIIAGKKTLTNNTSWEPQDVEQYLKKLDTLGRPIHLSEITIPAPGTDAKSNAMQAQLTRDMYRLWFSWPSIYRITWWNVVDGCGFRGEPTQSGLFTRSMEPKPVYFAMDQLVNHEWKTNLTVSADTDGKVSFRGFKGKYRISWTDKEGTAREKTVFVGLDE